jgi:cell division protein FtsB
MEHLLRQVAEATRAIEIATAQIELFKAKVHDLEIENQRLRDQLAFRVTQYQELNAVTKSLESAFDALQADNKNLKARVARNVERIRRMEEGEL